MATLSFRTAVPALVFSFVLCGLAMACPCSTVTVPATDPGYNNIDGIKFSHTSQYRNEFRDAIAQAKRYCQTHVNIAHRAVVSDLDETLFDNREFDKANPIFEHGKWAEWVSKEKSPAFRSTREFLAWARGRGFAIFLVTTRGESMRGSTIANLLREGISYDGLFMRPDGNHDTHEALKTRFRKQIEEMGFTIVVNLGDQYSDLAGGYAQDCEKVPNRMYFNR